MHNVTLNIFIHSFNVPLNRRWLCISETMYCRCACLCFGKYWQTFEYVRNGEAFQVYSVDFITWSCKSCGVWLQTWCNFDTEFQCEIFWIRVMILFNSRWAPLMNCNSTLVYNYVYECYVVLFTIWPLQFHPLLLDYPWKIDHSC